MENVNAEPLEPEASMDLQREPPLRPTILSLPENTYWLDNPMHGSYLVVRACYERMWSIISTTSDRRFAIIGSPGIGKSWFLFLCMCKLAEARILFLYISNKGQSATYYVFQDGQTTEYSGRTPQIQVLVANPGVFILIDDRPPFGTERVSGKVIVASSPDPDKYKDLLKEGEQGVKLYMPVWKDEELEAKRLQHTKECNVELSASELRELVNIAGRVPRYIFRKNMSYADILWWNLQEIDEAVQSKPVEKMLEGAGNLTAADKDTSHRILAIEVDESNFTRAGLTFHSLHTRQVALRQLANVSRLQLFNYYKKTHGSLKGNIFEWYAHRKLATATCVLEKDLEDENTPKSQRSIPESRHRTPHFDCTETDLLRAGENEYLVPADQHSNPWTLSACHGSTR
jgi:hypothetical protein